VERQADRVEDVEHESARATEPARVFKAKKIERANPTRVRTRSVMRCCEGCVTYTGLRQGVARALPYGQFDLSFVVEFFAF